VAECALIRRSLWHHPVMSAEYMLDNSGKVRVSGVTLQAPSPTGHTSGRDGLGRNKTGDTSVWNGSTT
jgi:hypothetical protein